MSAASSVSMLEEALCSANGRVLLVEDCVETSGAFVLHLVIKRSFASRTGTPGVVLFIALAQPFSHYDRILRKLGCNMGAQMENRRLFFFDMLSWSAQKGNSGVDGQTNGEGGLFDLYKKILGAIQSVSSESNEIHFTIVVDDISLLDAACLGSTDHILDFLHYCHTLSSELGCSLVILNHEDIYSTMVSSRFNLQLEYLADVLIKAQPLATGAATDVHGQLTIVSKGVVNSRGDLANKILSFHYKVKENTVVIWPTRSDLSTSE